MFFNVKKSGHEEQRHTDYWGMNGVYFSSEEYTRHYFLVALLFKKKYLCYIHKRGILRLNLPSVV